jgi:ABC-type branched-subunit amino acid transport system permease subunit
MVGTIMIYAILPAAWTSVGYTGQVLLGHAGLFGVGSHRRRAVPEAARRCG